MTPAAHAAGAQAPARGATPIPAGAICADGSLVPPPGAYSLDVSCGMPGDPCVEPLLTAGPPAPAPAAPPQPSHPDRSPWRQRGAPVQASMMVTTFEAPEGPFHAGPTAPVAFDMPCAGARWPSLWPSPQEKRCRDDLEPFPILQGQFPTPFAAAASNTTAGRATAGHAGPSHQAWYGGQPLINSHPLYTPTRGIAPAARPPTPTPPPTSHRLDCERDSHVDIHRHLPRPGATPFGGVKQAGLFDNMQGPQPKRPRKAGGARNRPGGGSRPISTAAPQTPRPQAPRAAVAAVQPNRIPHYMRPMCIPRPTRDVHDAIARAAAPPPTDSTPQAPLEEAAGMVPLPPDASQAPPEEAAAMDPLPPGDPLLMINVHQQGDAAEAGDGDDVDDVEAGGGWDDDDDADSWLDMLDLEPFETDGRWAAE